MKMTLYEIAMLLCIMILVAASAASGNPTEPNANALYVDPTRIEAIAFPSMRIAALEGSLPIDETLHLLCRVLIDDMNCIAWRNLTFMDEDRVRCYASDPDVVVTRAVVHCTYVPSKDERAVVLNTIEHDSCRVDVILAAAAKPAAPDRGSSMWVPRNGKEALEATVTLPAPREYTALLDAYRNELERRQIVQFSDKKYDGLTRACNMKRPVKPIASSESADTPARDRQNEPPKELTLAVAIITYMVLLGGLFYAAFRVPWLTVLGESFYIIRGVFRGLFYVVVRVFILLLSMVAILLVIALAYMLVVHG